MSDERGVLRYIQVVLREDSGDSINKMKEKMHQSNVGRSNAV